MDNTITVTIKGIEIHGLHWGNPDGEPVLALHGWLDNAASFANLEPFLRDYHVVAIDLPGHGMSGHWPEHAHYHLWAGVEDIECILDQLGWQTCHVMAHSMGAAMATLYAGTFPDRLRSLTLIEAIGPMAGDFEGAPKRLAEAIRSMKSYNPKQKNRDSIDSFVEARLAGHLKLSQESAELIMARSVYEHAEGFSWRNDKRLRYTSMMRLPEELILSFIQSITCPVLGIFATDGLYSPSQLDKRWKHLSNSVGLHWFDGGHHLHMDGNVKEIAGAISRFWEESAQGN
jgi:pimeloyl-ACP methyl ester carboxylesterase